MKKMVLREAIRFFSQHRTLYCYLCLSLWIFLLIAGKYKCIVAAACIYAGKKIDKKTNFPFNSRNV